MVGDRGRRPAVHAARRARAAIRSRPTSSKVAGAADPADASPSLVAILGDSRLKMMGYVGSMVFTADGRSLISAANHEIAFWDPRTGEQERVLRGHTDRVDALAISRDGQTLVSGSYDHLVKVWDVAAGKERLTLKGHRNVVSAVAISPDGKLVASARQPSSTLGHIRRSPARPHEAARRALADRSVRWPSAPTAGLLVSGGDDGKINVWEVEHRPATQDASVEPLRERWKDLAFSPDGATLAAAGV